MSAPRAPRGRLLGALLCVLAAAAPDEADERADAALERLDGGLADESYEEIAAAIVELDAVVDEVSKPVRKKVIKALGDVFRDYAPRKDTTDDNSADVADAYGAAIGALFQREGGPELLEKALKQEHVREWPAVQVLLLEGLGYARDPARVKLLAGYLEGEHAIVVTAAARALGELREADLDARRKAAVALLERYEAISDDVEAQTRRGNEEETARAQDLLDLTEVGFNEALSSLCRQSLATAADWRAWYDEHGRGNDW